MPRPKTSRWQSYWIYCRSLLTTCRTFFLIQRYGDIPDKMDKICVDWATRMLNFIKLKHNVINPHNVQLEPGKHYVVMSSHSSLYDIPLAWMAFPKRLRMLGKKELFSMPFWGKAIKKASFISIDRSNTHSAIKSLEFAKQKMDEGFVYWVAPEGTRSRTGKLMPLKKGAFMLALQTQATIIPIGIRGAFDIVPPGKTYPITLNQTVEIHIGQPLDTSSYQNLDRSKVMGIIRERLLEATEGE